MHPGNAPANVEAFLNMKIEPTAVVVINALPNVGECFVIRKKPFPEGLKWELKDMYGRTWHKAADELRIVKNPIN